MRRIPQTLHAPASRRAANNEMVATYSQTFEDAPRDAPASRRAENNERVAIYAQNFKDAPRASVTTRRNQREGCHLRSKYRGRSTRQRSNAPKTTRRSPLTPKISRTLQAPASRRAGNTERVATNVQNLEDAPRASVTTRGKKQREGRHLRLEFRGRSTR